jgi:hypothetical protein
VGKGEEFDIIFDFTSFTARSRLPNEWLRLALGLLPLDIRQKWRSAFVLNVSDDAKSFLRHVLYLVSGDVFFLSHIGIQWTFNHRLGLQVSCKLTAVSSVAELQRHFPECPTLMASSHPCQCL